jgi:16S rRNA (adenine1518-N6/adenine1519-N6)-dimethyltransferase
MPLPRKRFGQHWLKDATVHRAMVVAAGLNVAALSGQELPQGERPCVLEVGPGTGELSRRLLAAGADVVAVEIDRRLCSILQKKLGQNSHFTLVQGDVLEMPLPERPSLLVANIPYNITSPLLDKVLGTLAHPVTQFQRIVLLVQRELAERLSASPGTKAYSAMSVRSQYLADCQIVQIVPPKAFQPPPQVESAIICLTPRPYPTPTRDRRWLGLLVQQGFATRRKQLTNTLQSLATKEAIAAALVQLGLDPHSRAEALTITNWIDFSNSLLPARATQSPPFPEPLATSN